jgi:DNA-binding IclR family transcriptional regulator
VRDLKVAQPDVDTGEFLARLAQVREFGHATSINERGTGAASIAAPFFDADGHVLGSVSSSGPASRYSADVDERHQTHARQVVTAADTITGLLRPGGTR